MIIDWIERYVKDNNDGNLFRIESNEAGGFMISIKHEKPDINGIDIDDICIEDNGAKAISCCYKNGMILMFVRFPYLFNSLYVLKDMLELRITPQKLPFISDNDAQLLRLMESWHDYNQLSWDGGSYGIVINFDKEKWTLSADLDNMEFVHKYTNEKDNQINNDSFLENYIDDELYWRAEAKPDGLRKILREFILTITRYELDSGYTHEAIDYIEYKKVQNYYCEMKYGNK